MPPPNVIKIVIANNRCSPFHGFVKAIQLGCKFVAKCVQHARHREAISEQ